MEMFNRTAVEEYPAGAMIFRSIQELKNIINETKAAGNKSNTRYNDNLERQTATLKLTEHGVDKTRDGWFKESTSDTQKSQSNKEKSWTVEDTPMKVKATIPRSLTAHMPNLVTSNARLSTGISRATKPSTLDLAVSNGEGIEPSQPSAALRSLESARWITTLDPKIYPPSISTPDPELNQSAIRNGGHFKYDIKFLLQFEKYFIEKPCVEFDSRLKDLNEKLTKPIRPEPEWVSDKLASPDSPSPRNSGNFFVWHDTTPNEKIKMMERASIRRWQEFST